MITDGKIRSPKDRQIIGDSCTKQLQTSPHINACPSPTPSQMRTLHWTTVGYSPPLASATASASSNSAPAKPRISTSRNLTSTQRYNHNPGRTSRSMQPSYSANHSPIISIVHRLDEHSSRTKATVAPEKEYNLLHAQMPSPRKHQRFYEGL